MRIFRESLAELKDTRRLCAAALLLALAVILGFFTLQVTDYFKFGFSFLADELCGMLFGPAAGLFFGAAGDVLKYLVHPTGPFFPGFTLSAAAGGVIYGLVLYKRPLHFGRIFLANALHGILIGMLLNTWLLTLLYGTPFIALFPARALQQLVQIPLYSILFYSVTQLLERSRLIGVLAHTP